MTVRLLLLLAATPAPSPTTAEGLDPNSVTPGVVGFLATFAVVVVSILLFVNMARRIRRIRYRAEQAPPEGPGPDDGDASGEDDDGRARR